jgi:hypothetical protein
MNIRLLILYWIRRLYQKLFFLNVMSGLDRVET